ncbi:pyruvate dehydrogenase E1 component beta subunit [Desulforhopalus singaporensis]|uniref:Pyruvate dehydrogenase E1 component beta subunit n=1 Tax=Desulforhopalus singaporensis TaxID=91360 RepID=A0A1H0VKK5_9BACT|nr:pyruvate dehydrogenase E1 component beta subunit [Desulforhopalus singaporensis]
MKISVRQAINDAIKEEMNRDSNVTIFGCDVGLRGGAFAVTKGLLKEFGEWRVRDTPISEAGFTGIGIGAAATGLRPIVEILYCDWITLAMDQIVNTAAKKRYMFGGKINMPLTIRAPFGGGDGQAAQHSQSFEAWFNHVPGLKVIAPIFPEDVKGLLKSAIRDDNPVIFFEHKLSYTLEGEVPSEDYTIPIGKAKVIREGSDVTIVSYSMMVVKALEAAETLAKEGIECEVIDLRSLLPLDYETIIDSLEKTNRIVVVHEANLRGGMASDIVAEICDRAFDFLDAPPERVGGLNVPIPYCSCLEQLVIPSTEKIKKAVYKALNR